MPGSISAGGAGALPGDVRALRRALELGVGPSMDAGGLLSGLSDARRVLADPLGAHARASVPDAALRASLVTRPEAALPGAPGEPPIRLAADAVSVAVALADELYINERDAALLLADAREQVVRRADRDLVGAAKDMFYARRRECVLFLQEVLRVHLLTDGAATKEDVAFHDGLIRERDALFVEHGLLENVVGRIVAGLPSLVAPSAANPRPAPQNRSDVLANDEAVLLAECVFLLAYSVQMSAKEALAVRDLLVKCVQLVASVRADEEQALQRTAYASAHHHAAGHADGYAGMPDAQPIASFVRTRAESLRNVVFLAWICCIDRSRYSDLYDPRSGVSGVNALLRDGMFIKSTCSLPPMPPESATDEELPALDATLAAAELGGALFRLATAEPDKEEAIITALRVCASWDALEFLSGDLANWIEKGGGSLLPDSHLYADVLEDLAFDLSEAPDLAVHLFRCTLDELQNLATAEASYGPNSPDAFPYVPAVSTPSSLPGTPGPRRTGGASYVTPGKPPKPPAPGRSPFGMGYSSPSGNAFAGSTPRQVRFSVSGMDVDWRSALAGDELKPPKNLIALLGMVVGRAVELAPGKLQCASVGGGARYWGGVGVDGGGIIHRIGECVVDMFDAAHQTSDARTVYEGACKAALEAFLKVLAVTALPSGNVVHAGLSLRFLCHAGHSVVSIDRTLQALSHYSESLSVQGAVGGQFLAPVELSSVIGALNIISNCSLSMVSQGGLGPIMGRPTSELASRISALAVQDVPFHVRAALVKALQALNDHRASLMFLDEMTKNKSAKLRQSIRGQEAERGCYDATVSVLEITAQSCKWSPDEFSSYVVEGVSLFALEEVVAHWSQRKYANDFERWRLIRVACELLLSIVGKERADGETVIAENILSRLLCPAPGTGAASPSLRALASCAGLRRAPDDIGARVGYGSMGHLTSGVQTQHRPGHPYAVSGRDVLAGTASSGDGEAFREMERSCTMCARALTFALSLVPSQFSSHSMITARASDLLLSEPKALISAGSLVFSVDECTSKWTPFRMGYSTASCAAILEMLASVASQSTLACKLLTRSDESEASGLLRCSLADVVSSYSIANGIGRSEEHWNSSVDHDPSDIDGQQQGGGVRLLPKDRPRMHSALHLVEACLGMDGGGKPGLFLLGLVMDIGDDLQDGEYGVLSALMELVSGIGDGSSDRIDERSRSTAAVFLERLAGNTTAKTSSAVLEFIRRVGSEEGPGGLMTIPAAYGDAMLNRILRYCQLISPSDEVDWSALGELGGACMKLSALLVRQYPSEEEELFSVTEPMSSASFMGQHAGRFDDPGVSAGLPSPDALIRFVASVAGSGRTDIAVDAFRNWHQLLGARLSVHPVGRGYGSVPLLLDVCTTLLDALESNDGSSRDFGVLVGEDGGAEASSVVLRCLGHIAAMTTSRGENQSEFLGDSQSSVLLAKVVRALAGRADGRADASQTRTSLYAAFLVCGQLCETKASDESIAQAFAGRVGARQTNGAEALVSVACEDGIAGPSAASRAAALVALSVATRLDPIRLIPALSSQNRLRRLVASAVGDPVAHSKILRNCARGSVEDEHAATENGTLIIAESALGIVHAVGGVTDGVRALADAACLESISSLLEALSAPRRGLFGIDEIDEEKAEEEYGSSRMKAGFDRDGSYAGGDPNDMDGAAVDDMEEEQNEFTETPSERFASVASMLTAAVAAAVVGSDAILVDGALSTLQAGFRIYSRIIRALARPKKVYVIAVSHISTVLSQIPPRILVDSAVPSQLRLLLASHLGYLVPSGRAGLELGGSGSPMSAGLRRILPRSARDARRFEIQHPEGGSLFERDMVSLRLDCLKCVFSALRVPSGLLTFFATSIDETSSRVEDFVSDTGSHFVDDVTGRQGSLGDVLRIARTALAGLQHSAEEHIRLSSVVADETAASFSSRRLADVARFCMEEMDVENEDAVTGHVALDALTEASRCSRQDADSCVSILESALFILREYTSAASEVIRGNEYKLESLGDCRLTFRESESLLSEAQSSLLPLCKDIDAVSATVWGLQDPSFCRQLGRQIRTSLTVER